jgi:enoyl-CoA hydratase/carnithine racemase
MLGQASNSMVEGESMVEIRVQEILTEHRDGVMLIRINRPDRKNALTLSMYTALTAALESATADPEVRVAVVTGSGDSFTSGNDIADFLAAPPTGEDSPVFQFLAALRQFEKPLIAAVTGIAVGIGVTLLLHCDLVYAQSRGQDATAVREPRPVPGGGVQFAAATVDRLSTRGRIAAAGRAVQRRASTGLGADQRDRRRCRCDPGTGAGKAQRLAQQPAAAVRLTKRLLKRSEAEAVRETMALEGRYFAERLHAPEAIAALQAFAGRRRSGE